MRRAREDRPGFVPFARRLGWALHVQGRYLAITLRSQVQPITMQNDGHAAKNRSPEGLGGTIARNLIHAMAPLYWTAITLPSLY